MRTVPFDKLQSVIARSVFLRRRNLQLCIASDLIQASPQYQRGQRDDAGAQPGQHQDVGP